MRMTSEQREALTNDPKRFLSQGEIIRRRIAAKQLRIIGWRSYAESITSVLDHAGDRHGSSGRGRLEAAVMMITELEEEIAEEIAELVRAERVIQRVITKTRIDEKSRAILELRHLNGYDWEKIAEEVNAHKDWCRKLYRSALEQVTAVV